MARLSPLACLLFLASSALPALASPRPAFIVHTTQGPLPPAALDKLAADWSIELAGKPPRRLLGKQWVSLRQQGVALPPFPSASCAVLTSGERLVLQPGAPFRLEGSRLFLGLDKGPEISFPLPFLSLL